MSFLKVRPGCVGLNIELMVTSMVILVVHQDGIAVFKRKSQTPVAEPGAGHVRLGSRHASQSQLWRVALFLNWQ
jgi:hypothetical protein